MFELDAPRGLGDAIYLRALALHLTGRGDAVTVFTRWPDVFADLPVTAKAARTGEEDIRHCSYCLHCRLPEVAPDTMFRMACRQAGVLEDVPLRAGWTVRNPGLLQRVRKAAAGRLVLVYQPPKVANGPEQELLQPRREAFRRYVESRTDCYRIKVGTVALVGDCADMPAELDLIGKTTIADALDAGSAADVIFGEPCYLVTWAQALDTPAVCMFSRRAADARQSRVRQLTPARYFHKPEFGTAIYDE